MNTQDLYTMRLVKVGPSLAERWERRVAAQHHQRVINRLQQFRTELETGAAPESWARLETPLVLVLADICDVLGLDAQEKAQVLGQTAPEVLADILETQIRPRPDTPINERQAQALHYAKERGRVNQRVYQQLYPDLSAETLRLDLADLVARGLLQKHGNCRGTYYTGLA